jgi:hypothetical protein
MGRLVHSYWTTFKGSGSRSEQNAENGIGLIGIIHVLVYVLKRVISA